MAHGITDEFFRYILSTQTSAVTFDGDHSDGSQDYKRHRRPQQHHIWPVH